MITKFFILKHNEWECVRSLEENLSLTKTDMVEFEGKDYKIDSRTYSLEANVLQLYLTEK
jgi:hypothetical protein